MPAKAATRDRILAAALQLFRKQGFEATTMRQIAKIAGTSLGSAYYYFPRKEALVLAYFEDQMLLHEARAAALFETTDDLSERVKAAFLIRLELMESDQGFFGGLLRTVGEPDSSVSVFSKENAPLRARGIGVLRDAVSVPSVDESVREDLALILWALVLLMVLYFVHDRSEGQHKTRTLVLRSLDLLLPMVPLLATPPAAMLRREVRSMLADAALWPS